MAANPPLYQSLEGPENTFPPRYSPNACDEDSSLLISRLGADTATLGSSRGKHASIKSSRMSVDLGEDLWGTKTPAYGLGATIDGTITFKNDVRKISKITITVSTIAVGYLYRR